MKYKVEREALTALSRKVEVNNLDQKYDSIIVAATMAEIMSLEETELLNKQSVAKAFRIGEDAPYAFSVRYNNGTINKLVSGYRVREVA